MAQDWPVISATLAGKEALSILTGQREGKRGREREERTSKRRMREGVTVVRGLTEERDKRPRTERPALTLRSLFRDTRADERDNEDTIYLRTFAT